MQPITAASPITFNINGVSKSTFGEAVLRVSIGRDHGRVLKPVVKVNGAQIIVPDDWRGYDQADKNRFFGTLEMDVPYSLINTNNTVSVEFPDTGGHVSSAILQVFSFSNNIRLSDSNPNDFNFKKMNLYPNPTTGIFNLSNSSDVNVVSVYNLSGLQVKKFDLNEKMDISQLSSGIYFVKTDTGNLLKLIKI